MSEHLEFENDAAAYVLGALEPDEAQAFVRHMESCPACRKEVSSLEHVVGALPLAAPAYKPSRRLRRRVMRGVRAEPRHPAALSPGARRWQAKPITAVRRPAVQFGLALLLALAILGGVELASSGSPRRVIQASVGRAQLRLNGGRGQLIVDQLPPTPRGRVYEMWVQRGTGRPAPSSLFDVSPQGTADVRVPGRVSGVSSVLVTVEPSGGSRAPTSQPVIVARLT